MRFRHEIERVGRATGKARFLYLLWACFGSLQFSCVVLTIVIELLLAFSRKPTVTSVVLFWMYERKQAGILFSLGLLLRTKQITNGREMLPMHLNHIAQVI